MTQAGRHAADRFGSEALRLAAGALEINREALERAAEEAAGRLSRGGRLFSFGCGHSGLVAQDVYYRAGGLMDLRCLFAPEIALDREPPEESSLAERRLDWVRGRLPEGGFTASDVVVVISTSGVNAAPVEMARLAAEAGAFLIAVTSRVIAEGLEPRHPGGRRLHELAAVTLDNLSPPGDALVAMAGDERMGSASTAVGALLLQSLTLMIRAEAESLGRPLPVYVSGNRPGGLAENRRRKDAGGA